MTKNKKNTVSKFIAYDNLDKIGEIAVYYGFTPKKRPVVSKADIDAVKDIISGDYIDDQTEDHNKI